MPLIGSIAQLSTIVSFGDFAKIEVSQATKARVRSAGIELLPSYVELVQQCDYILSIVPPRHAIKTAELVSAAAKNSSVSDRSLHYIDLNAVSPRTARHIATIFSPITKISFLDGGIIGGFPIANIRENGTVHLS